MMTSDKVECPVKGAIPDLMDDDVLQCPYPTYQRLRDEEPVYYYEKGGFYVVSRLREMREILANPGLYSNDTLKLMGFGPKTSAVLIPDPALIFADPPQHGRTRSTVDRAFTPARVNGMEAEIQALADEIFDAFIEDGRFEVFSQLAELLPVFFIAGQLGVPRADFRKFRAWSDTILRAFNPGQSVEEKELCAEPVAEFNAYMLARRAEKTACPAEDIISVLAVATPDSVTSADGAGERLSDKEFLSIAQMLLVAGNDTTTSAILSVLYELASDPEMFARLKANPRLIPKFVEEVLRLEAPVQGFFRVTTADTILGDVALPKGSFIYSRYASGNRDSAQFEAADKIDLERRNGSQHLTFGGGIHHCIGQMLARKELACVVSTLCKRMATLAFAPDQDFRYVPLFNRRSLVDLHLVFTREA